MRNNIATGAAAGRIPNGRVLRLFSPGWIDFPISFIEAMIQIGGDILSCIGLFFEPFMDPASLIDLSIGLLLLERVGISLEPPPEAKLLTEKMIMQEIVDAVATATSATSSAQTAGETAATAAAATLAQQYSQTIGATTTTGAAAAASLNWYLTIVGSPLIALCASLLLVYSCLSNYTYHTSGLVPFWLRVVAHHRSVIIIYVLVILFCIESILIVSILLLACHAITFPQHFEENMTILLILSGFLMASLTTSNVVRYSLYHSIGD